MELWQTTTRIIFLNHTGQKKVGGLTYPEDRDFLKAEGLIGTDLELQQFIERYENPSILKLIADRVRTIHGGRVAPLVAENVSVYTNHDTVKIIDAEFRHLGKLEQSIVYWLAIWRNPLSYQQLQTSFRQDLSVAPKHHRSDILLKSPNW